MATLEQIPSTPQEMDVSGPLNSLLARAYTLNWEAIFYVGLFVLTILTRFVGLGDRVASHDESLHMKYSFDLYKDGNFQHTPLMHGPVLFHATALMYFLFGPSDFSARLYPAILGTIMVFMPKLLFERWLGKFGALVTSVLILISPMLLFHNRYIREDTPALFFTLLMAYAIFAFLDGVKPRQMRYLVLFSGATLLSLASKETGFMYIAVFGALLTVFLGFQLIQGWRDRVLSPAVAKAIVGLGAVLVIGVASSLVAFWLRDQLNITSLATVQTAQTPGAPATPVVPTSTPGILSNLQVSASTLSLTFVVIVGVPLTLIGTVVLLFLANAIGALFREPGLSLIDALGVRANSLFKLVLAGVILGTVAAIMFTFYVNIITPDNIASARDAWTNYDTQVAQLQAGQTAPAPPTDPRPEYMTGRLIIWGGLTVIVLAAVVLGAAVIRFRRLPTLPWVDIFLVGAVALIVAFALLKAESASRNVPNQSSDTRPAAATSGYNLDWIDGSWVIGIAAAIGLLALRFRTSFFQDMKRYPVFDILIVLGTLILPWLAAYPIFKAGYPLDANSYPPETITACILGALPFVLVAAVAGLCWEPTTWLICAGTFYSLFAFFYTTIFTNVNGIATGAVGSLGYWLTQQGVRRGSQPQYYYGLEVLIYEYLPLIGAFAAGIIGMLTVWRFRADRYVAKHELALAEISEVPLSTEEAMAETQTSRVTELMAVTPEMVANLQSAVHDSEASEALSLEESIEQADLEPVPEAERLVRFPFLGFVGCWAALIFMALTMAGEKMPWLTTHITLPLIFLAGWYVGTQLEKFNWATFWKQSWALIILIPVLIIGVVNIVGPTFLGNGPFGGLTRDDQLRTFGWMGAIVVAGIVLYAIYRVWKQIRTDQLIRVAIVGAFVLLGILTARIALMAAFINYDLATEFMVYAHSAPSYKTVVNLMLDISRRTTDGMNIKMAYDDLVSWPGSWYFRIFPQARFLGMLPTPAIWRATRSSSWGKITARSSMHNWQISSCVRK